jgi:hypothetical protein
VGWTIGVRFPAEPREGFSLFAPVLGPIQGPTQPPIQLVPGVLTPGVKLTTNVNIVLALRMCGAIPPLPIRLRGVVLKQGIYLHSVVLR